MGAGTVAQHMKPLPVILTSQLLCFQFGFPLMHLRKQLKMANRDQDEVPDSRPLARLQTL